VVARACEYLCERRMVDRVWFVRMSAEPRMHHGGGGGGGGGGAGVWGPAPGAIAGALGFALPPAPASVEEALIGALVESVSLQLQLELDMHMCELHLTLNYNSK
jgi:hypothetical protein